MWTIIDSPVGELRLVARDGALTAVEFLGEMPAGPARPRASAGTREPRARCRRPAAR